MTDTTQQQETPTAERGFRKVRLGRVISALLYGVSAHDPAIYVAAPAILGVVAGLSALVPPNKRYPLAAILDTCRRFPLKKRSRITFEYVMLDGVNDTPDDARRLVTLLAGIKSKVNLIPLNPAPGIPYDRPSDERVNRFANEIRALAGVQLDVRAARGDVFDLRDRNHADLATHLDRDALEIGRSA